MTTMDQAADRQPSVPGDAPARREYAWSVPEEYNFALDTIGRWAEEPEKTALRWHGPDWSEESYSFASLDEQSSRVAHALERRGVTRGDRVVLMLPRVPEWWETLLGLMKLGAVGVPCAPGLALDDLRHRAVATEAAALVTDRAGAEEWARVRARCPSVRLVMVVGEPGDECPVECVGYHPATDVASPVWYSRVTRTSDPSQVVFTDAAGLPEFLLRTHGRLTLPSTLRAACRWLNVGAGDLLANPSEMGWAALLDAWFDSLPPAPHHWCPLNAAATSAPVFGGYLILDQACRIVPAPRTLSMPASAPVPR